jgi:hypothetical protein
MASASNITLKFEKNNKKKIDYNTAEVKKIKELQ